MYPILFQKRIQNETHGVLHIDNVGTNRLRSGKYILQMLKLNHMGSKQIFVLIIPLFRLILALSL